jgi:hypothetical protein
MTPAAAAMMMPTGRTSQKSQPWLVAKIASAYAPMAKNAT